MKQEKPINFRAPDDERIAWENNADRMGLPFSKWLREACREFYKKNRPPKKNEVAPPEINQ